jgi:putative restriction endonuclease
MIPAGLNTEHILAAIDEIDRDGVPDKRIARKYFLQIDGKEYPIKYVISIANKYLYGDEWPFDKFVAVEALNYFLSREYTVVDKSLEDIPSLEDERDWRMLLWKELGSTNVAYGITPQEIRNLDIYGGQQGIWVDKKRTQSISNDDYGIAVSVIHKGDQYPDDFDESGVIYHYPNTNRPKSRDLGEIESVKNCKDYDLPIFVIRVSPESAHL